MQRRTFNKIVGAGVMVAVSPSLISQDLFASDGQLYKSYEKTLLVDKDGNPIKVSNLKEEVSYIFNYPYVSTPCFLLKMPEALDQEVKLSSSIGEEYVWKGGVGKGNNIVSYSGICSHALTHPNPEDSFVSYVPRSGKTLAYDKGGVIVCSSHLSAYDPLQGAKNVSGEAKEPLASVVLEYDEANDQVYAVGVLGVEMFHKFFRTFKPQLKDRFKKYRKAKKLIKVSTATVPLTEYSKEVIAY